MCRAHSRAGRSLDPASISTSACRNDKRLAHTDRCPNGASRDRTGDLLLAKQALSQLSYGPSNLKYTRYGVDFRSPAPVVTTALGLLG
jgi:hypothetical protein